MGTWHATRLNASLLEERFSFLFQDWGKAGDIHNLSMQWHIPTRDEKLFVKELLDMLLQPELKKLEGVVQGTESPGRWVRLPGPKLRKYQPHPVPLGGGGKLKVSYSSLWRPIAP